MSSDSCRPRRRISTVLRQRRAIAGTAADGGGGLSSAAGPAGRMSSSDVERAFRALLEETLPPEKQDALMETFEAEPDAQMRYNMLLEFSSYLRQGSANGGGGHSGEPYDADDKYRPKPRRSSLGLDDDDDDANLCWEICRVLLIVAAILLAVLGAAYALGNTLEPDGNGNGRIASTGAAHVNHGIGADEPEGDEGDD